MDMLGEIVEYEIEAPNPPQITAKSGFPDLNKLKEKKVSRWKQRQESKKVPEEQHLKPIASKHMSEAEKIHQENLDKIAQMTKEEIEQEQAELLNGLDPNLIKSLLKRSEKKERSSKNCCGDGSDGHVHAEGFNGWIGGGRTDDKWADVTLLDEGDVDRALGINRLSLESDLKLDEQEERSRADAKSKSVRFEEVATVKYEDLDENVELDPNGWEDVEDVNDLITGDIDDVAHKDYQLVNDSDHEKEGSSVHFPKPIQTSNDNEKLDLNDPDFYDKLHEKYFPDLPKETHKLSWMTEPLPKQVDTTYESISDMRFDFKGDLVDLLKLESAKNEVPTYLGLHHHSDNPHLPGYTLSELVHLSRSVLAGQRSFSIQILGRILHKLGLHKYNILPVGETEDDQDFNENLSELMSNFENLMWDLIGELRIIESLTEAADESKTRNLSVRNYAIEALWLWKQGGGRKKNGDNEESSEYIESNMAE